MIRILDGLYLGNREAARDLRRLRAEGITHIVNCAEELPNYHAGHFDYLALKLRDPDDTLHQHFPRIWSFIDEARRQKGRVLIHCFAAISRSPAVVLSYLCHLGDTMEVAAARMGQIVWCDPDIRFLEQIARHHGGDLPDGALRQISCVLQGRSAEE